MIAGAPRFDESYEPCSRAARALCLPHRAAVEVKVQLPAAVVVMDFILDIVFRNLPTACDAHVPVAMVGPDAGRPPPWQGAAPDELSDAQLQVGIS